MVRAPYTGEVARLWEEAVASPDDDGVRAVLADLLQAAGDPRGELISLQLLSAEDAAAVDRQDRIQELLRGHLDDWLGSLREIARAARFDRGFLAALEISADGLAHSQRWAGPLTDRTLRTVTELPHSTIMLAGERGVVYSRFVATSALPALRRIEVFDAASVGGFESCAAPLTHVACMLRPLDNGMIRPLDTEAALIDDRILPECDRRSTITSLAMYADTFPVIERCRWFERLSTITVACEARRGLALWPRVPPDAALVVVPSPGLEPCTVAFPWDYRIELVREAGALIARIAGEWVLQPLATLAALPRKVSRIEIEHTSELMARRVSEAVARPGVEVVVRAPRRAGNIRWT